MKVVHQVAVSGNLRNKQSSMTGSRGLSTPKQILEVNGDSLVQYVTVSRGPKDLDQNAAYVLAGDLTQWGTSIYRYLTERKAKSIAFLPWSTREIEQLQTSKNELQRLSVSVWVILLTSFNMKIAKKSTSHALEGWPGKIGIIQADLLHQVRYNLEPRRNAWPFSSTSNRIVQVLWNQWLLANPPWNGYSKISNSTSTWICLLAKPLQASRWKPKYHVRRSFAKIRNKRYVLTDSLDGRRVGGIHYRFWTQRDHLARTKNTPLSAKRWGNSIGPAA